MQQRAAGQGGSSLGMGKKINGVCSHRSPRRGMRSFPRTKQKVFVSLGSDPNAVLLTIAKKQTNPHC